MNKKYFLSLTIFTLFSLLVSCNTTPGPVVPEGVEEETKVQKETKEVQQEVKRVQKKVEYGLNEPGVYAVLKTNKGLIRLNLFYKKVPNTVANFVGLSEGTKKSNKNIGTPFYDGTVFHRVIADFMIQGGDPTGTGRGGPGYRFEDEFDRSLRHNSAGILSMANAGPNTNGSQFFITHKATPWLDNRHSVFGKVVGPEDQSVVNAIRRGDQLISVTIVRVGSDAEAFGK